MKRAELQRKRLVMVRDVPEQNSSFVLKKKKKQKSVCPGNTFRPIYTAQLCCIRCIYDNPLTRHNISLTTDLQLSYVYFELYVYLKHFARNKVVP